MTTSHTVAAPKSSSAGGLAGFPQAAADVAEALAGLKSPAQDAADAIDQAFSKAGSSLAKSLASAASTGKLSLGDLAKAGVAATEAIAGGSMSSVASAAGGLGAALGSALGGVLSSIFGGARADGGAVSAGSAYLVGERGPELFRPGVSGQIDSAPGGGGTTINLNLSGASTPAAFVRSEAQIAQALARASSLGTRR
jgi:phage-related minor tail protein